MRISKSKAFRHAGWTERAVYQVFGFKYDLLSGRRNLAYSYVIIVFRRTGKNRISSHLSVVNPITDEWSELR